MEENRLEIAKEMLPNCQVHDESLALSATNSLHPLRTSCLCQVWNQNGKNPSITFEYTLLRKPHSKNLQPIYYTFSESESEESREFDGDVPLGFIQHNATYFGKISRERIDLENQVFGRQDTEEDLNLSKGQETNEVYERAETIDCEPKLKGKQPQGKEETWASLFCFSELLLRNALFLPLVVLLVCVLETSESSLKHLCSQILFALQILVSGGGVWGVDTG